MKKKSISILLVYLSLASCSNNSEDDLIIKNNTIETKTYTNSVKSIIDANCISCHGSINPNAGLSLTTFNEVKQAVLNKELLDRISRANGASGLMPSGARMPQQTIDVIIKWNADGLLEQ